MDNWILNFSDCFDHTWVDTFIDYFIDRICMILFRIFVPQVATLPTDNSTSEWDRMKYLFDNFDSSRNSSICFVFQISSKPIILGVEDSISFAIFTLSIIGFFLLTIYTVNDSNTISIFIENIFSGLWFNCLSIIINTW
jgi:hypothetical protein